MVPCVDLVVAVTVMCVLLFVLHVCMLRECEVSRMTAIWCGGWKRRGCGECMVWHLVGKCGSRIASSAADVLGMSVVRGMRGVGGVCEMCMYFWGEWLT